MPLIDEEIYRRVPTSSVGAEQLISGTPPPRAYDLLLNVNSS